MHKAIFFIYNTITGRYHSSKK